MFSFSQFYRERKFQIVFSLLIILLILFSFRFLPEERVLSGKIILHDAVVPVWFAHSEIERVRGLSGLSGFDDQHQGMLFIFPHNGFHQFWMKDMNFPLDILWFDENRKLIFFKKNAQPDDYPQIYIPPKKARYVLELPAGDIERRSLRYGDIFRFSRT